MCSVALGARRKQGAAKTTGEALAKLSSTGAELNGREADCTNRIYAWQHAKFEVQGAQGRAYMAHGKRFEGKKHGGLG